MATESAVSILEGTDKWPSLRHSTRYGPSSAKMAISDLDLFLKGQRFRSLEVDVIPSRSGSAPPSMEGSLASLENIFYQQRSAPGVAYPSSFTNNCESPSLRDAGFSSDQSFDGPLNSWKGSYKLEPIGGTGSEWTTAPGVKHATSSVLIPKNNLPSHVEESEDDQSSELTSVSVEKDALLGHHSGSLDATQEDSHRASSPSYDQFLSFSHKSMDERVIFDADSLHSVSIDASTAGTSTPSSDDTSVGGTGGTLKRRPIHGRDGNAENFDTPNCISAVEISDTDSAYTEAVKIVDVPSASVMDSHKFRKKVLLIPQYEVPQQQAVPHECNTPRVQSSYSQIIYPGITLPYGSLNQLHYGSSSGSVAEVQPLFPSSGFMTPVYPTATPFMTSATSYYPHLQTAGFFTQYNMGGYYFSPGVLHSYISGYPPHGAVPLAFSNGSFPTSGVSGGNVHAYDVQNLQKFNCQVGFPLQQFFANHFHLHYMQPSTRESYSTDRRFDHQTRGDGSVVVPIDLRNKKKGAELVALPNDRNSQNSNGGSYNNSILQRGNKSGHHSLGSPSNAGSPVLTASVSPVALANPLAGTSFSGGRYSQSPHSLMGNHTKDYGFESRSWNNINSYSFLEELKSGNGQRFELCDILGHIGEFSVDQHGSRFIQQRLETCSIEEKASVLKEVIPHASKLMTDVFGNYVVQKLFEFGSPEQRKELANQLEGQILSLSLQMYGCRVIQKALEVIDLEQKVRLARELDGHVMRCVRDQNGNHVIQKCIESIPGDIIHFIISSFRGQVASLSTHPYGCRVIQRVLEHCSDELQTQFIVDEILDSVCSLAQDQYGNYVTQHVLERGKPNERIQIIEKLCRSIVKLSQHKFASNVVEKCLEYSDFTARDMLIKEIVGHGDKNCNLLVMMKDQYANYVIQKILQKCTGNQREMLLGLIKNHLAALKKYTYGKHIVARFEQLCAEEVQTSGP